MCDSFALTAVIALNSHLGSCLPLPASAAIVWVLYCITGDWGIQEVRLHLIKMERHYPIMINRRKRWLWHFQNVILEISSWPQTIIHFPPHLAAWMFFFSAKLEISLQGWSFQFIALAKRKEMRVLSLQKLRGLQTFRQVFNCKAMTWEKLNSCCAFYYSHLQCICSNHHLFP